MTDISRMSIDQYRSGTRDGLHVSTTCVMTWSRAVDQGTPHAVLMRQPHAVPRWPVTRPTPLWWPCPWTGGWARSRWPKPWACGPRARVNRDRICSRCAPRRRWRAAWAATAIWVWRPVRRSVHYGTANGPTRTADRRVADRRPATARWAQSPTGWLAPGTGTVGGASHTAEVGNRWNHGSCICFRLKNTMRTAFGY